jgi:NAD(P)-dependent dehydrogenase (short-subunit alcohol dehydrogenase family)
MSKQNKIALITGGSRGWAKTQHLKLLQKVLT